MELTHLSACGAGHGRYSPVPLPRWTSHGRGVPQKCKNARWRCVSRHCSSPHKCSRLRWGWGARGRARARSEEKRIAKKVRQRVWVAPMTKPECLVFISDVEAGRGGPSSSLQGASMLEVRPLTGRSTMQPLDGKLDTIEHRPISAHTRTHMGARFGAPTAQEHKPPSPWRWPPERKAHQCECGKRPRARANAGQQSV